MPLNCNPGHFERLNRRGFLSVGVLAGAGLTLPALLRNEARADLKNYKNFEGTAKSVIHIYLPGGMAHQESFDPKPNAPIEYRGEMKQVATKISGELFGDTLAKTAEIADKLTVIRSMTHGEAAHERGTHNMFTGYRPSPALLFPCIGSVISIPHAEKCPGARGMMTVLTCSSRASAAACIEPPPPNAIIANSRGS